MRSEPDAPPGANCEILLVEDNPADALLVALALEENSRRLCRVEDGAEALDFLYKRGRYSKAQKPAIVFLDLNLPKVSGSEVLKTIKSDTNLAAIPIIVLSSSKSPTDISNSYKQGANSYIVKPVDVDETFRAIQVCREYWLNIVSLQGSRKEP